jgi:hypothetical protein
VSKRGKTLLEFEEIHAYDQDQVIHILLQTLDIIERSDVPPDLRVAAFECCFKVLSQKVKLPKMPEALKGIDLGHLHA